MREKSATSSPASGPVREGAGGPSVIAVRAPFYHPAAIRTCVRTRPQSPFVARRCQAGSTEVRNGLVRDSFCRIRTLTCVGRHTRVAAGAADRHTDDCPSQLTTSRRPSMSLSEPAGPAPEAGRPLVFRGGTVLMMDDASTVLRDADVLVVGDRIEAVGAHLDVPEGTKEIDARGGIVMPGMIDTHRHMWQTAMRGYGADWTLTQYFVWYYLEHGKKFRPEDIAAGNRLAAI